MRQPHEIIPRDDNMFDVVYGDTIAGPFPTISFALRVARNHPPAPAPVAKFRRFKIMTEVQRVTS